jgi:uncharacterized repeat protein (TIGR02543 family)
MSGTDTVSKNATEIFAVYGDTALVAHFTIDTYDVIVSVGITCGAGYACCNGFDIAYGDSYTVTAYPDPTCCDFVNWTVNGVQVSTNETETFEIKGDIEFVANFELKKYLVTVLSSPGGAGTVTPPTGLVSHGTTITLNAIPSFLYNFVEWQENGLQYATTPSCSALIDEPRTFTAVFEPKTYTITVGATSGGTACCGDVDIPYNTSYTVTANPDPFYQFSHWEQNGVPIAGAGMVYTFVVTGDRDLVAVFEPETFTIKVIADPITGGDVYGAGYNIPFDSLWTILADPYSTHDFINWTTLDNTQIATTPSHQFFVYQLYDFIIDGVLTLVAHFQYKTFNIVLSADPPEGGDVYIDDPVYFNGKFIPYGTDITIVAEADHPVWKFVEWREKWDTDTTWLSNDSIYDFKVTRSRHLVAIFEKEKYWIILLPNPLDGSGGLPSGGGFHPWGTELTVHAEPTSNYTFKEWTEDFPTPVGQFYSDDPDYTFPVTGPRLLYANFIPKKFKITATPEPPAGGRADYSDENILYGTMWKIEAEPYAGYEFSHWREDTTVLPFSAYDQFPVTRDRDLEAVFVLKTYTVTLYSNPLGAAQTLVGAGTYHHNEEIEVSTTPNYCYTFLNWTDKYGNVVCSDPIFPFPVTGDTILTANFSATMYDITLLVSPSDDAGTATTTGSYACHTILTVHATSKWCYTFSHWEEDGDTISTEADYTFTVLGPRTLTAVFVQLHYDVNLSVNLPDGGTVSGGDEDIPCGDWITIEAIPEDCYRFMYWTGAGFPISANPYTFIVDKHYNLTANFEYITYNITTVSSPTSGGNTTGGGSAIPCGDTITVCAYANSHYTFTHWTDMFGNTVSPDSCYTFVADNNYYLTAHFQIDIYALTLEPLPQQGGSPVTAGSYPYGTLVPIQAQPDPDYAFYGWYEADTLYSNLENDVVAITSDRHLVAHYTIHHFTIDLQKDPIPGGDVYGEGDYPVNSTITVEAEPNPLHNFVEWQEFGVAIPGAGAQYTFIVTTHRTLTAIFEPKTYSITVKAVPDSGGWAEKDSAGFAYGDSYTVIAHPFANFNFLGWFEGDDPIPVWNDTVYTFTVVGDRHLQARFALQTFTVNLSASPDNGGDVNGGGNNIQYGSTIFLTADAYDGYHFLYWKDDDTDATESNIPNFYLPVLENRNLTAYFETNGYNITVEPSPEAGGKVEVLGAGGVNVPYGEMRTVRATANPQYDFIRWENPDGTLAWLQPDYDIVVTCSRHLIAVFDKKKFIVTVAADPQVGGTVTGEGYDIPYGTLHPVTAKENDHYTFYQWTKNGVPVGSLPNYTVTVTENCSMIAHFVSDIFTLNLLATPTYGGDVEGAGGYYYNVPVTASAIAKIGYVFTEWTKNGNFESDQKDYTFNITENQTLLAHFEEKNVDVTVIANPVEGGEVSGGGVDIPCNTPIPVKAVPYDNNIFINWTDAATGDVESWDLEFTFVANRTCTLMANFELINYRIDVIATPPQYGTVTGDGNYDYGTPIVVSALANEDYMFTCWTENGDTVSTSADYSFTVTGSRILLANFEILTFTVTLDVNNAEFGEVAGAGKYGKYDLVTVRAIVKTGYSFLSWTKNDVVVSKDWKYEFEITEDVDLVAHFYALEFDDYAATLWDNTFMLNLKRFDSEHYKLTGCKWFKDGRQEISTNTIDDYSYSAGPKSTDLLELAPTYYMFHVTTQYGVLYSTKKEIGYYNFNHPSKASGGLYIYPNPVIRGCSFRVEGADVGSTIKVYNQYGVCISSVIAQEEFTTLSLDLSSGIYLIRANDKEAKVVVVNM